MKKKVAIGSIILFGLMQLVPYGLEHSNPQTYGGVKWDTPETEALFNKACADCHSHATKWPTYSSIAPISWLVTHDVEEGREKFNVSMWGIQKRNKGEDAAEELEENEMPPAIYTLMHPEAKLSQRDKEKLISGFKATFGED